MDRIVKKQIYLDRALNERLKEMAAERGESESRIVREALAVYMEQGSVRGAPLQTLIGIDADPGGRRDMAANHDVYLYGPEADE